MKFSKRNLKIAETERRIAVKCERAARERGERSITYVKARLQFFFFRHLPGSSVCWRCGSPFCMRPRAKTTPEMKLRIHVASFLVGRIRLELILSRRRARFPPSEPTNAIISSSIYYENNNNFYRAPKQTLRTGRGNKSGKSVKLVAMLVTKRTFLLRMSLIR